jgi:hypothetical protein
MAKRRKLMIGFAILGVVIAAVFCSYFHTDPPLNGTSAVWASGASLVLCPGSFLFVTFIDAEPHTSGFAIMWLLVGLINFLLYGAIGAVIGKRLWKSG